MSMDAPIDTSCIGISRPQRLRAWLPWGPLTYRLPLVVQSPKRTGSRAVKSAWLALVLFQGSLLLSCLNDVLLVGIPETFVGQFCDCSLSSRRTRWSQHPFFVPILAFATNRKCHLVHVLLGLPVYTWTYSSSRGIYPRSHNNGRLDLFDFMAGCHRILSLDHQWNTCGLTTSRTGFRRYSELCEDSRHWPGGGGISRAVVHVNSRFCRVGSHEFGWQSERFDGRWFFGIRHRACG
jgi:hypothetical protein